MSVQSRFNWHLGEDLTFTFTATANTTISGWSFSTTIYDAQGGASLFSTTAASITDANAGVFTVPLNAASTTTIGRGAKWIQVRRTNSGVNTVLAEGPVTVTP